MIPRFIQQSSSEHCQSVAAALHPAPTGQQIDAAVAGLRGLAEMSYAREPGAYMEYQRLMHYLHYGDGESTYLFRQWLASRVYDIEESHIPLVDELAEPLSAAALQEHMLSEQKRLSPLAHPLFKRLYSGEASLAEVNFYLLHKWIIMLTFWRSIVEVGVRFQRIEMTPTPKPRWPLGNVENTSFAFKNVYEELGEGQLADGHLAKHHRLMTYLNAGSHFGSEPSYPETYEYINNRVRCMRHAEPMWGAGSFFSQEATSLEYTMGHYHMLRAHDVPEEYCHIYYIHDRIDTEHTSEILQVIGNLGETAEQQRICITSQQHQMNCWNRHFDRVWEDMQKLAE